MMMIIIMWEIGVAESNDGVRIYTPTSKIAVIAPYMRSTHLAKHWKMLTVCRNVLRGTVEFVVWCITWDGLKLQYIAITTVTSKCKTITVASDSEGSTTKDAKIMQIDRTTYLPITSTDQVTTPMGGGTVYAVYA